MDNVPTLPSYLIPVSTKLTLLLLPQPNTLPAGSFYYYLIFKLILGRHQYAL